MFALLILFIFSFFPLVIFFLHLLIGVEQNFSDICFDCLIFYFRVQAVLKDDADMIKSTKGRQSAGIFFENQSYQPFHNRNGDIRLLQTYNGYFQQVRQ